MTSSDDSTVYMTRTGSKFHDILNCPYLLTRAWTLAHPKRTTQYTTTWATARSRGLVACPHCSAHRLLDPSRR